MADEIRDPTREEVRKQVRDARAWLARVDTWLDPKKGEISLGSAVACAEHAASITSLLHNDLERLWEKAQDLPKRET